MKRVTNFLSSGDSSASPATSRTRPVVSPSGSGSVDYRELSTSGSTTGRAVTPTQQQPQGSRLSLPPYQPQQQGMLQPTSPNGQQGTYFNMPAQLSRPPSREPVSPSGPMSDEPSQQTPIDRTDLHKLLKSYETVLVTLDEYRQVQSSLSRLEKKLSKGCSELAKSKAIAPLPSNALSLTASIFDSRSEASTKYSKVVQKEYEALNEQCAKYFKKVAKEERNHDDLVETLEGKVRKAQSGYEKVRKNGAGGPRALEAHDKYISTVSALTNDITRAKTSHALSTGSKSHATNILLASTLGGLAETSFRASCESVKRTGNSIGPLMGALNFCASEAMPASEPVELSEDELGRAAALAVAEAQAEHNRLAREEMERQAREQAVAAWKAQQLGWFSPEQVAAVGVQSAQYQQQSPPQQQQQARMQHHQQAAPQPQQSLSNLPKLDATGREVNSEQEASESAADKSSPSTTDAARERDFRPAPPPPAPDLASSTALARADTQNSLHSMAVTAREWEQEASVSGGGGGAGGDVGSPKGILLNNDTHGSEGTMIDRGDGEEDERSVLEDENNDNRPLSPSQSASVPTYETTVQNDTTGRVAKAAQSARASNDTTTGSSLSSSSAGVSFPLTPSSEEPTPSTATAHQRRLSTTWENEREKARTREREVELERRLRETEERLKFIERVGGNANDGRSVSAGSQLYRQEVTSPHGVSRTLSTDSERSFVARMKARYQYEKEAEREALIRSRGSGQTAPPQSSRPVMADRGYTAPAPGPGPRRMTGGYPRDDRERIASPTPSSSSYRTSLPAPTRNANEFGSLRGSGVELGPAHTHYASPIASRPPPPPNSRRQSMPVQEGAHSDICGCAKCSARHYGGGVRGGGGGGVPDGFGGFTANTASNSAGRVAFQRIPEKIR